MHGICGFSKTTLLDYPGHIAATIFLGGCSFRCPFCHNGGLVTEPDNLPVIEEEKLLSFLEKRKGILQGVCITGGEPLLNPELPKLIRRIKALGYLVKLDTNGYQPAPLRAVLEEGLVDYVAMDVKAGTAGYEEASGHPALDMDRLDRSVTLIMQAGVDYEFRTTVTRELHTEQDFYSIGEWIAGARAYYLQAYAESEGVIKPGFHPCTREEMERFAEIMKRYVTKVEIRGMDDLF